MVASGGVSGVGECWVVDCEARVRSSAGSSPAYVGAGMKKLTGREVFEAYTIARWDTPCGPDEWDNVGDAAQLAWNALAMVINGRVAGA